MHHRTKGTSPDVEFTRADTSGREGRRLPGRLQVPRGARTQPIAEDADTRAGLRADGTVVFQFDWEAVNGVTGEREDMPWPPYQGNAQAQARTVYGRLGGDPAELPDTIWCDPVQTLLAYLTDPDPARWLRRAEAAVAGLLRRPVPRHRRKILTERIVASLLGHPLPPGGDGPIGLARVADDNGCAGHGHRGSAGQERGEPARRVDRADAFSTTGCRRSKRTRTAHRRRWAAWLYWGNIVQFLSDGAGDGDQIAYTNLEAGPIRTCWRPRSRWRTLPGCAPTTRCTGAARREATPWAAGLAADPRSRRSAWTCPGRSTCSLPR